MNGFDIALTNPPFSMWYEMANEEEARILRQYEVAKGKEGSTKFKSRARSMELFIERYYRLLRSGGRLLTIIDESILSSRKFEITRNFIRRHFIIRAIISLHGDAFRMSGSRVKTALLYLEKKEKLSDVQPSVFMCPSIYLGVDDLPVTSSKSKIEEARKKANEEIETICKEFDKYVNGKSSDWVVMPEKLTNRLDLKFCLSEPGRFVSKWKKAGYQVIKVSDIANPVENIVNPRDQKHSNIEYRILTISYEGRIRANEVRKGKYIGYDEMKVVNTGDLVFSEYNSVRGAIGFVTEEFEGALASGSYTVVRCENEYDTLYLWLILRSTELRAEMLGSSIGVGRQTNDWADIGKIQIPLPDENERKRISQEILDAWEAEKLAEKIFGGLKTQLDQNFYVESEQSRKWFEANKPPR